MTSIIDALEAGVVDKSYELSMRRLLILDNFMPYDYNSYDLGLIHGLKGAIRNSRVSVIVSTSNRDAACRLLAENGLNTISPLATWHEVDKMRDSPELIIHGKPVNFNWEDKLSVAWKKKELKKL